jgi:hypothetical protein
MAETKEVKLMLRYGLALDHEWPEDVLSLFEGACSDLVGTLGGAAPAWMRGLKVRLMEMKPLGLTGLGLVRLNPRGLTRWTIVHELAHAWDFSSGTRLSRQMQRATHSNGLLALLKLRYPANPHFWYHVGSPPPPCGTDVNFNRMEDFAESVAAFVYPELAKQRAAKRGLPYDMFGYDNFMETPRGKFIGGLVKADKKNTLE